MPDTYVGAVDQGTTGTRFVVVDRDGRLVAETYERHEQHYPEPGWVEHDATEILSTTRSVVDDGLAAADIAGDRLAALGVTTQRETVVCWDAATGEPVAPAIVWQDRRTADRVEAIRGTDLADAIRERTGLTVDAYFSATKVEWLLDEHDLRDRAAAGEVLVGTVDAWLVWSLTGVHATDVTNASRTMLFDVHELAWDDELLAAFDVPRACLPAVHASSHPTAYGTTDPDGVLGAEVPVTGVLGDQQAALFGQICFEPGDAKNTYGTGSFLLLHTGTEPVASDHGLLTTVAYQRAGEPPRYALEGSVFATGAAVEWLADVGLVDGPAATEALARSVDGPDGVYVVPAFSGLGAPHWDQRARGTVVGLTRGTERAHLARATLEAIGFQTRDVVEAMVADAGLNLASLRVDGGAVGNDLLCQLQADVLGTEVVRPAVDETTALGAAFAAGLAVDYWETLADLRRTRAIDRTFVPRPDADVAARYDRWGEAVERSLDWAREDG